MSGALAVGAAVGALASHGVRRFSGGANREATTNADGSTNAASSSNHHRLLSGTSLNNSSNGNNKHVGIVAMEVYTPSTYIKQEELEEHSGVPSGKYTIGLGQEGLGFCCGDAEDVNSMALTVVHSLLEK